MIKETKITSTAEPKCCYFVLSKDFDLIKILIAIT